MKAIPNLYFINDIFEIHIRKSDWQKIYQISERFQLTFTATVRCCLFQLLADSNLDPNQLRLLKQEVRAKYKGYYPFEQEENHRHKLCLYGDDGLRIRILAARYGLTIADLVRISLELYLGSLENDLLEGKIDVVQHGIKIYENTGEVFSALDRNFHNYQVKFNRFKPNAYWPWTPFPFFRSG